MDMHAMDAGAAAMLLLLFQCRICGRRFPTLHGMQTHVGRDCKHRSQLHSEYATQAALQAAEEQAETKEDRAMADADAERRRCAIFEKTRRAAILDDLTRLRYDVFMPSSHVDQFKAGVTKWLELTREELVRRLTPLVGTENMLDLEYVARTTMDLFDGIRTTDQEGARLRDTLPLLKIEPRILGESTIDIKDAEGNIYRSKTTKHYCHDVPIDASLHRLMEEDPKAWEMVQLTMKEWSAEPPTRGSSRVIADIVDGSVFYNHPKLGDGARRARIADGSAGKAVHLALILYYDDLTVPNGLGNAALKHNYAMFYYALVNLSPAVRMSLKYIQLVTVCYSSDLKRFGPSKILGGGTDDPWDGTSCGASLRRLDRGVEMDLKFNGQYETRPVHCWAIWLSADFPARGKLSPYAESTASKAFDGKSNYHSERPGAQFPTSYMADENLDLDHFFQERSNAELDRQKQRYLAIQKDLGDKEARQYLHTIGISEDTALTPAFMCALLLLPYFDISGMTGMIGEDLMHHEMQGVLKFELALMLYYFIRVRRWFTTEELNARIASFPWPTGYRLPPLYKQHIEEGIANGQPKHDAHVHLTASQMLTFAQFSVALFTGDLPTALVKDQSDPLWVCWCAHLDYLNVLLAYSFTYDSVVHLDRLIFRHQTLFTAAYPGYWKPKFALICHFPMDILRGGPPRLLMTMRFEAMNQVFKRIMVGSNFLNPFLRMATFWNVKSGRELSSGAASSWGETTVRSGGDEEPVTRPAGVFLDHLLDLWQVPVDGSASVAYVQVLYHAGNDLVSVQTWVLGAQWENPLSFQLARLGEIISADGQIYLQLWWYDVAVNDTSKDFLVPRKVLEAAEPSWTACHIDQLSVITLTCITQATEEADLHFVVRRSGG